MSLLESVLMAQIGIVQLEKLGEFKSRGIPETRRPGGSLLEGPRRVVVIQGM